MEKSGNRFPDDSSFDLWGKQSVRATFKLSEKAINSIGIVSVHMGIKQKSLFDHIIDKPETLDNLAKTIKLHKFRTIPRIQKTYVLSKKTIDHLEAIASAYDIPRDALVEYSVKKLESVILSEKENHKNRKKLFDEIAAHFEEGKKLLKKSINVLGEDDPFCKYLEKAFIACSKTRNELEAFIEKGKALEEY